MDRDNAVTIADAARTAIDYVRKHGHEDIKLYCGRGAYLLIGDEFEYDGVFYTTFPTAHLGDYEVLGTPSHEIDWPNAIHN